MRHTLRSILVPLFLISGLVSASGQTEPSGETVAVIQATTASGPGGNRTLAPERPIYSGDTIVTDDVGLAQIRFRDDTKFVVGPRSSVVIDEYVFNPNGSLAGASLEMTRGAFRFISGNGPKRNYQISTPTATIGIRGTEVDVASDFTLGTGVLVFDGIVQLCSRITGSCTLVRAGCGAAFVSPSGELENVNTPDAKEALINASFPLVNQEELRDPFRVNLAACGLGQNSNPAPPQSPSPPPLPDKAGIVPALIPIIGGVVVSTTDGSGPRPASP